MLIGFWLTGPCRVSNVFNLCPFPLADYCQAVLREGKGAAFMAYPSFGELLPFGYQVIDVIGYSDMWGKYRDRLVCKVSVVTMFRQVSPYGMKSSSDFTNDKNDIGNNVRIKVESLATTNYIFALVTYI